MATQRLPIGVQSFEKMIRERYNYVDKTQYIVQLLRNQVYFLSRPRRFGKSLFLSTLATYFRGQKELFKGLYLEKAEVELARQEKREAWLEYPVLYLDFNTERYAQLSDLENSLNTHLVAWEKLYGKESSEGTYPSRFKGIIQRAYEKTKRQVVILVDEYDKPLLDTLNRSELNEPYHDLLRGFYSVIKSSDPYLRFAFLTGVTKFSKVSVFSGLNNLRDISLQSDFAAICGITEQELKAHFMPEIEALASNLEQPIDETLGALRKRYDGYLFAEKGENVYNPFSLLNAFASRTLKDYWYETGTPTFLVKYLYDAHYNIPDLEGEVFMSERSMSGYRAESGTPLPILFQAGYLTIKGYSTESELYTLGYPNDEVRYGFLENLIPAYTQLSGDVARHLAQQFVNHLREGNTEDFMRGLQALIAGIPYDSTSPECVKWREQNYQTAVYLIFKIMGFFVQTEAHCATGRADCVVHTPNTIYLFEFKLWSKGTAEKALAQIKEKGYAEPFRNEGKKIVAIGVSFNNAKHSIKEWKSEVIE